MSAINFKRLCISDWRQFASVDLCLSEQVTILTGSNGCGKTTLLNILGTHFGWENLTIACTECNRRKNDYFSSDRPFLDPYVDDVEELVIHYGPVVSWQVGHECAEISVKTLELHNGKRVELMLRKVDRLNELDERLERHSRESNLVLKEILWRELQEMRELDAEYSAMVRSVLAPHSTARADDVPSTL